MTARSVRAGLFMGVLCVIACRSTKPMPARTLPGLVSGPLTVGPGRTEFELPLPPSPMSRSLVIAFYGVGCAGGTPEYRVHLNLPASQAPLPGSPLAIGTLGPLDCRQEITLELSGEDAFNFLEAQKRWDPGQVHVTLSPVRPEGEPPVQVRRVYAAFSGFGSDGAQRSSGSQP